MRFVGGMRLVMGKEGTRLVIGKEGTRLLWIVRMVGLGLAIAGAYFWAVR